MTLQPLILTAGLDPESQHYFDDLRKRHFPPERNFLRAHVTLFHALPFEKLDAIRLHLAHTAQSQTRCEGQAAKVQPLGNGVAFVIESRSLASLRAALAQSWHNDLTSQDRQKRGLHITVQNKVTPEAARKLLCTLARDFQPRALLFKSLDLWQYQGGPWKPIETFPLL